MSRTIINALMVVALITWQDKMAGSKSIARLRIHPSLRSGLAVPSYKIQDAWNDVETARPPRRQARFDLRIEDWIPTTRRAGMTVV